MMEHDSKSPAKPGVKISAARVLRCEEWEALLADAIDGTLLASDAEAFQGHGESCAGCAVVLEETRKGQQWLQFLHAAPPVPEDLLERILARTSGAAVPGAMAGDVPSVPAQTLPVAGWWKRLPGTSLTGTLPLSRSRDASGTVTPITSIRRKSPLSSLAQALSARTAVSAFFRHTASEPRMMMTAAMAFFSIALTLNLLGVHLKSVRMAALRPNTLQTSLRRTYITANARVSRYYDNLRIVYEVESRMREMQRTSEAEQEAAPKEKGKQGTGGGSAGKTPAAPGRKSQLPRSAGSHAYPQGHEEVANLGAASTIYPGAGLWSSVPDCLYWSIADAAERGRA